MKDNSYNSNAIILNSLRYQSSISSHEFKIDSENNLHILEQSIIKNRQDIVPLDLINPQPIIKVRLNKNLMLLALASATLSSVFFISAIYMNHLWSVPFAIIFWLFGIGSIVTAYKNRTKTYQYQFTNSNSLLFTLHEPLAKKVQVKLFLTALNKRIINVNKKSENTQLNNIRFHSPEEYGEEGKHSQYIKHLDFLFNHGIVDDILYKKLHGKIHNRIKNSENRFTPKDKNIRDIQTYKDNIINFPINA